MEHDRQPGAKRRLSVPIPGEHVGRGWWGLSESIGGRRRVNWEWRCGQWQPACGLYSVENQSPPTVSGREKEEGIKVIEGKMVSSPF